MAGGKGKRGAGGSRRLRAWGAGARRGPLTSSPWPKRRPSAATRSTRRKPSGSRPHTSNTWRRRRTERSRAAGAPAQPAPPAIRVGPQLAGVPRRPPPPAPRRHHRALAGAAGRPRGSATRSLPPPGGAAVSGAALQPRRSGREAAAAAARRLQTKGASLLRVGPPRGPADPSRPEPPPLLTQFPSANRARLFL